MDFRNIIIPEKIKTNLTDDLIEVIGDAPCTCPNPDPGDWPHNPDNAQCYRRLMIDALMKAEQ